MDLCICKATNKLSWKALSTRLFDTKDAPYPTTPSLYTFHMTSSQPFFYTLPLHVPVCGEFVCVCVPIFYSDTITS